MAVFGF